MIPDLSLRAQGAAAARQGQLTKPPGALGRLEELALLLAGIQDRDLPQVDHPRVLIAAADHGVAALGVSAYPAAVTAQMCLNFCAGGAAVNVLARLAGATVEVLDVGVASVLPATPGLIAAKIALGTVDFTTAPAMSRAQLSAALEAGAARAEAAAHSGCDLLVLGEMGIGNTTSAAALLAAALIAAGKDPTAEVCCGRGTGVDDAGLARKIAVVKAGLARHQALLGDPQACLAALGGLEIAALAGAAIRAAERRVPVLIDGFISTAAALSAVRIEPRVRPYLLFSHVGAEQAHRLALAHLQAVPLLDLGLRLGEGSGGVLAIHLLRAACRTLSEMATFSSAGVSTSS